MANLLGTIVGCVAIGFGLFVTIFFRQAFVLMRGRLAMLFGRWIADLATPWMMLVGGIWVTAIGILIFVLGVTSSFA